MSILECITMVRDSKGWSSWHGYILTSPSFGPMITFYSLIFQKSCEKNSYTHLTNHTEPKLKFAIPIPISIQFIFYGEYRSGLLDCLKIQISNSCVITYKGQGSFNPMRTTCWLVKMNILSYIEPIRRGVKKNSLMCKFVHATFLKPYHDWLHKWAFQEMNQSEMVFEGQ